MMRALLLGVALLLPTLRDHTGKVPWVTDPAAGMATAQSQNKMALLFFTASW